MIAEAAILEALRVCFDPATQINVVDLGRVDAIRVERDDEAPGALSRARVFVTLLPRDEEQDAMLAAQITNRLYGLPELSRVNVSILDSPAWTPDRMTAAGRVQHSKAKGLVQLG